MRKILLVDNDRIIREKLGTRLTKEGFEVLTSADGAGALEIALREKPDLVISNYHLPLFDAERLRAFLKNNPTTKYIPFIFLINPDRGYEETLASIGGDEFLVKPFHWQDIQGKIQALFQPPKEGVLASGTRGNGVEGSLEEVSLVDLLQIFGLNRRTGTLTLIHDDQSGIVHLLDGAVISAILGETSGEKALYRILRWSKGRFIYQPGETMATRNISRSMDALLMEGMRQLDEWESLVSLLPAPETGLNLIRDKEDLPQDLRPVTQEVILLLEFFSTVREIIDRSAHTDYEVCKCLLGLIQKGIVVPGTAGKSPAKKEGPLIPPERLIQMHGYMRPSPGGKGSSTSWGRIIIFSRQPEQCKGFLSGITGIEGFRLSRDNFSNQEILTASFGTIGILEISENAALYLSLLPSSPGAAPLWRAFSEGTVGAFYLSNNGTSTEDPSLAAVEEFVEGELDRPVITAPCGPNPDPGSGAEMFRTLFDAVVERHHL
ncbi:MAG: DUF4388 domain-containing protein [Proteobacteria bacterium]|nr:DUF4388 domain-containing protein [Pseudomonadota bacterium]